MKILICTDGSTSSIEATKLIDSLGFPKETKITVLGVSESVEDIDKLTEAMGQIKNSLGTKYSLERKIRNGNPTEEIMSEAVESSYDLVTVGGGGQLSLLQPQLGSTASKLARKLHTHFLVGRNVPDKINKVLVCTGTDSPARRTMKLGGEWISTTSAQVCLLHVIPAYKEEASEKNTDPTRFNVISKDSETEKDKILKQATEQLRSAGVKNDITPIIREGIVVNEVINELKDGSYDLLVIGAHYQPGQDRWMGLLLDDVADQLLNRSTCSVLII